MALEEEVDKKETMVVLLGRPRICRMMFYTLIAYLLVPIKNRMMFYTLIG